MSLPGGEDWIMRPVLHKLLKFESLKDGSVDIEDIALLNDALDVAGENERRAAEASKPK